MSDTLTRHMFWIWVLPRSSKSAVSWLWICHLVKLSSEWNFWPTHLWLEFFVCLLKNDESMAGEVDISDEHIKYVYVQKHHPSYSLAAEFHFQWKWNFSGDGPFSTNPLFMQNSQTARSFIKMLVIFAGLKPNFKLTYLHIIYGTKVLSFDHQIIALLSL